jgi:hypothetical protein
MKTMKAYQTVMDFFSATTQEECERHLYKYTDCGAWIEFKENGILLGSIVEGCDFGTSSYFLRYKDNFTSEDIQERLDAIEKEAEAIWEWANTIHDGEEDTWADQGLDAPDVSWEFMHLNPEY